MEASTPPTPQRAVSLDAYRGFVMLLMAGEVLRFHAVAEKLPESSLFRFLAHHQDHVEWRGCTLHDLIQPSFSFLVGCALPFSIANRQARGQGSAGIWLHTFWRAFLLIALGVFLRSTGSKFTNFTFEDTLSQIGLGYVALTFLAWRSVRMQVASLVTLLVAYWAWFAFTPLPGPEFDPSTVGVPRDWPHTLQGFAAHWNKNANPAHSFEYWFLNLFPRMKPWLFNGGGYLTLSFIPTLGTMILGLLAGQWIRRTDLPANRRLGGLLLAGLTGLALGTTLDLTGTCPSVKRIWTPSWVLFSGGWACLFLAMFHAVADIRKWTAPLFPLVVVGMNSIFTYVISHLWDGFFRSNTSNHLNTFLLWLRGPEPFSDGGTFWKITAGPYAPMLEGAVALLCIWLCCLWLWRHRIFIRI